VKAQKSIVLRLAFIFKVNPVEQSYPHLGIRCLKGGFVANVSTAGRKSGFHVGDNQ